MIIRFISEAVGSIKSIFVPHRGQSTNSYKNDSVQSFVPSSLGCGASSMPRVEDIEEIPKPNRVVDLTGQRYGSWLVLSYYGRKHYPEAVRGYHQYWRARCDCGRIRVVQQSSLRSGKSTQCRACAHGDGSWLAALRQGK
jgi:hypothetical protein